MGPAEILVSGGVAAVLAAVAGGGLKAFGVELPLLATVKRQALVMIVGAGLIALGLMSGPLDRAAPDGGTASPDAVKAETAQAPAPADKEEATPEPAAPKAAPMPQQTVASSGQVAGGARIPAVVDLPISSARIVLMRSGWSPINQANPMQNDDLRSGNGPAMIEKGYAEARACGGSAAQCSFVYRDEAGRILRVVTAGESDDPIVIQAFVLDCTAEPKPDECWAG